MGNNPQTTVMKGMLIGPTVILILIGASAAATFQKMHHQPTNGGEINSGQVDDLNKALRWLLELERMIISLDNENSKNNNNYNSGNNINNMMAESEIDGDYRRDNLEQDEPGNNSFPALQDLEDTFKRGRVNNDNLAQKRGDDDGFHRDQESKRSFSSTSIIKPRLQQLDSMLDLLGDVDTTAAAVGSAATSKRAHRAPTARSLQDCNCRTPSQPNVQAYLLAMINRSFQDRLNRLREQRTSTFYNNHLFRKVPAKVEHLVNRIGK